MSAVEVRRECRKFAQKFVDIQRQDFMRLAFSVSWDKPYLTMAFDYEARIAESLSGFSRWRVCLSRGARR